jgi:Eco29kI restriction endonuclease
MKREVPYNPLEKENLGRSVAQALLLQEAQPLKTLQAFDGAGIYALYYQGAFVAYQKLAHINRTQGAAVPIYVGKAIPAGGRKGLVQPSDIGKNRPTKALFKRLTEHAESIRATKLKIEDFSCRYLVVDDIWIPLGESLLITRFAPLWNLLLDGFGNHDPGAGRYNGLIPKWDVLHPGRTWASRCRPRLETAEQIAAEVSAWLDQSPGLAQSKFQVREAQAHYSATKSAVSDGD